MVPTERLFSTARIVGDYQLFELLGEGSMGSVFRAQREGLKRNFALKLVSLEGPNKDELRERAHREVLALAEFHHPNIVGLIDTFSVGNSQLAIVMDYVESKPLSAQLPSIEPPAVMLILRQIATALQRVHEAQLVHRDIKPSNVLVSWPLPDQPHAQIIDFGITHYSDAPSATQGFIGSPAYASPEQVEGLDVDYRTDIFSLGAIGFEAITGVAPFASKTVLGSIRKHVDWERPDLSPFYERNYPTAFCKIIEGCLDPDPERRPSSATTLVTKLGNVTGISEVLTGDSSLRDTIPGTSLTEPSVAEETVEAAEPSAEQRDMVWIENGVPFYQRVGWSNPGFIDMGNSTAISAAIGPDFVAFVSSEGSVHVIYDDGLRREHSVDFSVAAVEYSDEQLVCEGPNGEHKSFDV